MHIELENTSCSDLFAESSNCDRYGFILSLVQSLSQDELLILGLYTGLNRYGIALNRNQVSRQLGFSHAKVTGRLKSALAKMRPILTLKPESYVELS